MNSLAQALEGLTEDKFCTKHLAVDIYGESVMYNNPNACRWCVIGWFRKVRASVEIMDRANSIAINKGFVGAVAANDNLGYEFIKLLREEDK
jgi:hypothetical protein